jgi:hypothetical protein
VTPGLESYRCFKVEHLRNLEKIFGLLQYIKKSRVDGFSRPSFAVSRVKGQGELSEMIDKLESQDLHRGLVKIILGLK